MSELRDKELIERIKSKYMRVLHFHDTQAEIHLIEIQSLPKVIALVREHDTTIPDRMRRIDKIVRNERSKAFDEAIAAVAQVYCETYAESRIREQSIKAINKALGGSDERR